MLTKNDARYIIKRIILALSLAFIFFFLDKCNVLAASLTPTSSTISIRDTTLYCTSYNAFGTCTFDSSGEWKTHVNVGGTANHNSNYNPAALTEVVNRINNNNGNGFIAGNTYTFVTTIETSTDTAGLLLSYFKVWNVTGGNATNSMSSANIASFSYTARINSSNSKQVILTTSVTPAVNSKWIAIYYRDKSRDKNSSRNYMMFVKNTNIKYVSLTISYSESGNSYIEQNTQEIINQTNEMITQTNEIISTIIESSDKQYQYMTDDSDASIDVSGMSGITGIFPAGPLDSLLSLPLTLINILIDSSSGSCSPFTFTFVFNETFTLPCFDSFWSQVPQSLLLFLSDVPAVYIFIKWAKSIYKRVERATSFESSVDDEWGGV